METIHRAMKKNPKARPIIQSDRGYQYTSHEYKRLSEKYHFTKSMSRVGRCLDNQPIERFWGTYKAESFYIMSTEQMLNFLKPTNFETGNNCS